MNYLYVIIDYEKKKSIINYLLGIIDYDKTLLSKFD